MRADLDVPDNTDLPGQRDVISKLRAARNAHLGDEYAMLPDRHVVSDLDEIIDLRSLLNPCSSEPSAVDCDVRSDLHIVVYLNDSHLRDLHVAAIHEFESETVAPKNCSRVDDHPGTDLAPGVHRDARVEMRRLADVRLMPDVGVRADYRPRPNHCPRFHDRIRLNRRAFADADPSADDSGGMHPGFECDQRPA